MAFHVPEKLRMKKGRMASDASYGNNGVFVIPPQRYGQLGLFCIASDGESWEHVSVSVGGQQRCPSWEEMCRIKNLFWDKEDCVVQYHPPESEYVNCHPVTLHLWRKIGSEYETPPSWMVGPRDSDRSST